MLNRTSSPIVALTSSSHSQLVSFLTFFVTVILPGSLTFTVALSSAVRQYFGQSPQYLLETFATFSPDPYPVTFASNNIVKVSLTSITTSSTGKNHERFLPSIIGSSSVASLIVALPLTYSRISGNVSLTQISYNKAGSPGIPTFSMVILNVTVSPIAAFISSTQLEPSHTVLLTFSGPSCP